MFPLSSATFPDSAAALQSALAAALTERGLTPKSLTVTAPAWPQIETLALDLTGATATRDLRLPEGLQAQGAELPVAQLSVTAAPLLLEGTPLELRLEARDAVLAEAASPSGEKALTLLRSGPGQIEAAMRREDLQAFALQAARAAAQTRGGDIQDLQLSLTSESDRALRLEAKVTAKMGFMKAHLTLTGRAELDDSLQLHLSQLDLKGEGMASNLAAGFIRPQLEKAQAKPIPLAVLALGEIHLRAIRLTTGETIRAQAEFSS